MRFGVAMEKGLLEKFDRLILNRGYANRSEAIRDLVREDLVKKQWQGNKEIAGAITMIYEHHKRELVEKLLDIQHEFGEVIISNQHIHLDHHNCLEIIALKGRPQRAEKLVDTLRAAKGVKHATLSMSTTGRDII